MNNRYSISPKTSGLSVPEAGSFQAEDDGSFILPDDGKLHQQLKAAGYHLHLLAENAGQPTERKVEYVPTPKEEEALRRAAEAEDRLRIVEAELEALRKAGSQKPQTGTITEGSQISTTDTAGTRGRARTA